MDERRTFRMGEGEDAEAALAEAVRGTGETWFLACAGREERAALLASVLDGGAAAPSRLVRVRAPYPAPLELDAFVAQALGREGAEPPSEDDLVAVFELLTDGQGADRAVLVVDGAELLSRPVLRYVQLACQSAPHLQVVFAGEPKFRDLLAEDEFAPLRRRLRAEINPPRLPSEVPTAIPVALRVRTQRPLAVGALAAAALGLMVAPAGPFGMHSGLPRLEIASVAPPAAVDRASTAAVLPAPSAPDPAPAPMPVPAVAWVAEAGGPVARVVDAVAPEPQLPAPPPAPAPSAATEAATDAVVDTAPLRERVEVTPALAAALLARGNAMLAIGDISAARRLFERAAAGGSVPALQAAARAYDPEVLARLGATGIQPDAALAAAYRRRAEAAAGGP